MNDDVVAALPALDEPAPFSHPALRKISVDFPFTNLFDSTVQHDFHIASAGELAGESLKRLKFCAIDNDEFHGQVNSASATPMPCEIVRNFVSFVIVGARAISGMLRKSQSSRHFTTVNVTSTRIVSPLIGSAAVVNWVV